MSSHVIQVQVLAGKDRGELGRVVAVARPLNKVFVAGLNTVCTAAHHMLCDLFNPLFSAYPYSNW